MNHTTKSRGLLKEYTSVNHRGRKVQMINKTCAKLQDMKKVEAQLKPQIL